MVDKRQAPHLLDEPPVLVYPSLASALGINKAIVFQQLHFLLNSQKTAKNMYNFINGTWWVYNSYSEWKESYFCWLSESTLKGIFIELERDGLILSMQGVKNKSDRRKWYTIDYQAWDKFCLTIGQKMSDGDETKNVLSNGQKISDDYSETTTETTTEIKDSAAAALGDSASKNGRSKNGKEPETKRDYIFDLVAILFFGFRDMSLFDSLNDKSKKNMSGRIAKISSWLRDLYQWDEPIRAVAPSEKAQEIKRDCQQFCKWYAVQYKNAARPKDIEKFAVNYMDWIKEKTPVLLEPDKDCPKCRGLGYWIDKSNPNNHKSIDCECRSKQHVKSK